MPAVLITRPQASSTLLAQQLQALGYACFIDPMLLIEPVASPAPDFTNVQAVMITSGNALDALSSLPPALLDLPCFCVGAKTADKARACGFRRAFHTANDGADLARLITATLIDKNKTILHIAGRDIDSKAHHDLTAAGFGVSQWIVYAAQVAMRFAPATMDLLKRNKLDAVLLFSTRSAETFVAIIKAAKLEACCQTLDAIGFSDAVTAALKPLPWRQHITAAAPTEDAVIACLKDIHPVS